MEPPPLPRWYWLLPVLAMAAWWPVAPWWQSDDFLAVHYVQDGRNVLRDFVGPQYGATDVWSFYRPLITASFWLEQQLGGAWPPLSHVGNVVAHGGNALLAACVWRRFLPAGHAFLAALLWAVMPSHQGSIAWAVGRVDSHTTVWCLLTVLLALRGGERRLGGLAARRWPLVLTTAGALASKESALVLPALATFVVFLRAEGTSGQRLRVALAATAGAWLVLLAYVPLRLVVLGGFGGYDAAASALDPQAMLVGLAHALADLGVPLRWVGTPAAALATPAPWPLAAALPVVIAVLLATVRAPRAAAATLAAFALACVPIASFLAAADNPQTLRLYYLPSVALCGLVAAAGRWCTLAVLVAFAWPFVAMRATQLAADRESSAMHRALLHEAQDGAPDPMFVAGLPHTNGNGTVVQLHFGVDRLLQPPFARAGHRLYALRPLVEAPDVFRLLAADVAPFPLPVGSTWYFADASALVSAHETAPRPSVLPVAGDDQGVLDLTTAQLDGLLLADGPRPRLLTPAVRTAALRLTIFTANGYLATVFENHAPPDAADGVVDVRSWFADITTLRAGRIARRDAFIGDALVVPTTIDLSPEFPVLLEGGTLRGLDFVPTHRANRLLTFRFDRGYPGWVRRAQGKDR